MGQQEVYEFLKEHSETWFTSKEICQNFEISINSISMSLSKLKKKGDIERRRDPSFRYGY